MKEVWDGLGHTNVKDLYVVAAAYGGWNFHVQASSSTGSTAAISATAATCAAAKAVNRGGHATCAQKSESIVSTITELISSVSTTV